MTVVYRRSRKEMGAHYSEVDDAEHEGIKLEFFAAQSGSVEKNGRAASVEFQRMALGEPDASGAVARCRSRAPSSSSSATRSSRDRPIAGFDWMERPRDPQDPRARRSSPTARS